MGTEAGDEAPSPSHLPSRSGPHRQDSVGLERLVQAAHQRPLAELRDARRVGRVGGVGGGLHGAAMAALLRLPNSPNPVRAARPGTLNRAICRGSMATAA